MNTIEYKGFEVVELSNSFYIKVLGSKSRGANSFKADGYSTLNNAKGAITKHINNSELARHDDTGEAIARDGDPVVDEFLDGLEIAVNGGITLHKSQLPKLSLGAVATKSRNKREGIFTGKLNGHKIRLGKRNLPKGATKHIPVPSWIAAAWQNRKFVAKKVGV